MIPLSPRALNQVRRLIRHYVRLYRSEAAVALEGALIEASRIITAHPEQGLLAPRPYPKLRNARRAWVKVNSYWISYDRRPPHVITAVFYHTANIPGRI